MTGSSAIDLGRMAGSIIDGRWKLHRCRASSDVLAVFEASEVGSRREATIELVAQATAPDASLERWRCANLIEEPSHPSLLRVLDIGATERGLRYVAMERAHGETLSERLARRGRLTANESAQIGAALAAILAAIHAAGGVHGNLHPARVFVSENAGRLGVQLALGLRCPHPLSCESNTAALIRARHTAIPWNDVVRAVSTPLRYCAPEHLLGRALDARTDIYALGALLYELLRGTPPHACATEAAIVAARLAFPPHPLAMDVPAALRSEVERALEQSRSARQASARAFQLALEAALAPRTAAKRCVTPPLSIPVVTELVPETEQEPAARGTERPLVIDCEWELPQARSSRVPLIAAALLLLLAVAGTVALMSGSAVPPPATSAAPPAIAQPAPVPAGQPSETREAPAPTAALSSEPELPKPVIVMRDRSNDPQPEPPPVESATTPSQGYAFVPSEP